MAETDLPDFFKKIEDAIRSDPEIKAIWDARELETALNAVSGLSDFEPPELMKYAASSVDRINATLPYFNKPVVVSGLVMQPSDTEEGVSVIWDKKSVQSRGFTVRVAENGSPAIRPISYEVGHAFLIDEFEERYADPEGLTSYIPRHNGFARIGDVEIAHGIKFLDLETNLGNTIPDLKDAVDAILNSGDNETEKLYRLRASNIGNNDDIPESIVRDLELYITQKLDMDDQLPCRLRLLGLVYDITLATSTPEVRSVADKIKTILAYPLGAKFLRIPRIEGGEVIYSDDRFLVLEIVMIGENKEDPLTLLAVPFASVVQLIPLRKELFNQMEDI